MADSFHGRGGPSAACAADPVGAGVTDTSIAQATCVASAASASPTASAAAAEAEDELDLYGDIESTPQLPSEHELRTRLRTIQVRMARRLHHQRPLPTASAFPFSLCASSRLTQKNLRQADRRGLQAELRTLVDEQQLIKPRLEVSQSDGLRLHARWPSDSKRPP